MVEANGGSFIFRFRPSNLVMTSQQGDSVHSSEKGAHFGQPFEKHWGHPVCTFDSSTVNRSMFSIL